MQVWSFNGSGYDSDSLRYFGLIFEFGILTEKLKAEKFLLIFLTDVNNIPRL